MKRRVRRLLQGCGAWGVGLRDLALELGSGWLGSSLLRGDFVKNTSSSNSKESNRTNSKSNNHNSNNTNSGNSGNTTDNGSATAISSLRHSRHEGADSSGLIPSPQKSPSGNHQASCRLKDWSAQGWKFPLREFIG